MDSALCCEEVAMGDHTGIPGVAGKFSIDIFCCMLLEDKYHISMNINICDHRPKKTRHAVRSAISNTSYAS